MLLLNNNFSIMKIKMFGKKSVSAVLFWLVILALLLIIIKAIQYIPILIQKETSLILVNIAPLISYLALLIPLALLLFTFQRRTLFTKQSIRYLYLFASCNFISTLFYGYTLIYVLNVQFLEVFFLSFTTILMIIFVVFIAAVFKRGFQIQTEIDLTV